MGGQGSGNRYRWSKKNTAEDCKKIDIRWMRRKGFLRQGCCGTLHWTINGEPNGDIKYQCLGDYLILNYRYRLYGEDWQPVKQTIPIARTPCNYGHFRQWFECPRCGYRCAILYSADVLFLCRKCYNLPYRSQMQTKLDTWFDQKHVLGERIFEYYEFGEGYMKKKGMHQKTFDRLHWKYVLLSDKINKASMKILGATLY